MPAVHDFDHYRVFYYVAANGSMGKAADVLGMVPSSITKTIRLLEQELNCQLFVRTGKGVILTSEGKALFERVQPAFFLLQSGEQTLQSLHTLDSGTVSIGFANDIIPNAFTQWLIDFCRKYPNITIEMFTLSKAAISSSLNSGMVDLVLVGTHGIYDDNLNIEKLADIRDVPIVGGKYFFLADRPITLAELNQYPLIFTTNHSASYRAYEEIYRIKRLSFTPKIKIAHIGMQINAVKHGLGYSFIPETSALFPSREHEIRLLQITDVEPYTRSLCVVTSKNIPPSYAARAFIDVIYSSNTFL